MSGRYALDADGDVDMTVAQPIYEFIAAPRLKSWDPPALVKWSRDRAHYESQMRARCAVTAETYENVCVTVRGSMLPEMLENVATYILGKLPSEVMDEDLRTLIRSRCETLDGGYIPDLRALFRETLTMDMKIDDAEARVLTYFQDFNKVVQENRLQSWIGRGDIADPSFKARMKTRCTLLVENLQSVMLRTHIQRLVEFEARGCRSDDRALYKLIVEQAKLQHKFHKQTQELKVQRDGPKRSTHTPKEKRDVPKERKPAGRAAEPPQTPTASTPRNGCLSCKGPHWVKDCPNLTEAQRKEVLDRLQEKKNKPAGGGSSRALHVGLETGSEDGTQVLLNDLVTVPLIADSGSDWTIVPSVVLEELQALQPELQVKSLPSPVVTSLADGTEVDCTTSACLNLQLVTSAGVVNVAGVECLVMPTSREEVLLGNTTLQSLGINVDQQLARLAQGQAVAEEVDEFQAIEYGEVDHNAIDGALGEMVINAVKEGFDHAEMESLRELLKEFRDTWRDKLGPDPPAKVAPLKITLREDAVPYRCHARKYSPAQRSFLRAYTQELVDIGFVRRNDKSRWACAAVPVRKVGSADSFRITNDYRPVNKLTVPIAGVMPNLDVVLDQVSGSYGFAKFDLMKGFWQMPLHPDSQELMSFMTEDSVFTPLRVPQGAMDSSVHFQNQLQDVFRELLGRHCLIWIDDIIIYAASATEFIVVLRRFFELVQEHGLKLNVNKSVIFCKEVAWCGRLVSGNAVRHDPTRLQALSDLPPPPTIAALQQFVCAANWLRSSLPDYARTAAPLTTKLNDHLTAVGRRNRNALQAGIDWTDSERAAFQEVCQLIAASAPQHFPAATADICVLSDASHGGWGLIVSQVRNWNDETPVHEQDHELLICKGGLFKGSSLNWSIVEKEAYPLVKACTDLEYLLQRAKGFRMYTDHANLMYIFNPSMEIKRHVRDKLQRWAMRLCGLRYTIEHIDGSSNVWADIISRWGQPNTASDEARCLAVRTRRGAAVSAIRPLSDPGFKWPHRDDIVKYQRKHIRVLHDVVHEVVDGVVMVGERVWVPDSAHELLARLMVIAHCGSHGHRGEDPMSTLLNERFAIHRLPSKVQKFLQGCLLCKHIKGGHLVQRPWGPTYKAERRNEGVHWDFLTLGESFGESTYVLVIKDALTHYCELFPSASPSAWSAADGMISWYMRYGKPEVLVSDQGSHFRNEMVRLLCSKLKVEQSFTPVYSPWVNGTIERVNKDILQVLRALLIEYKLDAKEWPYLLPIVQANINHTPVESLGDHSPIELFLGLPAPSALDTVAGKAGDKAAILTGKIGDDCARYLDSLRAALHGMHKEVIDRKERKRLRAMVRSKGSPCNFDLGDYVLWSRVDKRISTNKLLARWVGPFKVVELRPNSFMIKHLLTDTEYEVHGSRLKFYSDSSFNVTEEITEFVSNQGMLLGVEKFKSHRFNDALHRWELLVSWIGLTDNEDSWESAAEIQKDVPAKVSDYMEHVQDEELSKALQASTDAS